MIVFGIREERENHQIEVVGGLDLALLQEQILSYLREKMQNHGPYELKIVEYKNTPLLILMIQETQKTSLNLVLINN